MDNENSIKKNVIKYNPALNPARRFAGLKNEFEQRAKEIEITPIEFLTYLIKDLKHYNEDGYEKIIKNVEIKGLTKSGVSDLINYLKRLIDSYNKETENRQRVKKKTEENQEVEDVWESVTEFIEANKDLTLEEVLSQIKEKSIFQKLNNAQRKNIIKKTKKLIDNETKKQTLRKTKIEKAWKDICSIVDRESKETEITKPQYWVAIRDKIIGQEENISIKLDESIKADILRLIDDKIYNEKELLYYNQVKYFTKDFSFLATEPEVQAAIKGRSGRKFTDRESFERFCELKTLLQQGISEDTQIAMILKKGNIDETSKRILNERMSVIEKQKGKQSDYFGIYYER